MQTIIISSRVALEDLGKVLKLLQTYNCEITGMEIENAQEEDYESGRIEFRRFRPEFYEENFIRGEKWVCPEPGCSWFSTSGHTKSVRTLQQHTLKAHRKSLSMYLLEEVADDD